MKSGLTAAILASITVLTGTSNLVAQQDVSMSIDGFHGIEWGSSEADVLYRFGEPAQIDSLGNGIVVLAYRVDLLGEPAVAFFALLGDRGMIKGQYIVKLQLDAGDCEGQ